MALEQFRCIVLDAVKSTGKYHSYLAGVLGISEAAISRLDAVTCRTRAYNFAHAVKFTLLAADTYDEALKLMAFSGNALKENLPYEQQLAFYLMQNIYSEGCTGWESRIVMAVSIIDKLPELHELNSSD